jgi:plastocyanin
VKCALGAAAVLFIAAVLVAGCGSAESGPLPEVTPSARLALRAKGSKFDKKLLATTAGAEVQLTLDNQDAGALHNFAVYDSRQLRQKLFAGELFTGKKSVEYRFTAPAAGEYYFRCDAHPDMNGTLVVKPSSGQ